MAKGLWEKHKIKRTEQVLDAADALFRDQGYEETKIEEIAELASVASATVYNYFKNKPNLLMEIALRHIRAAVPERREFIANMPDDPMDGIIEFEKLLADQAVRHRNLWTRMALRTARRVGSTSSYDGNIRRSSRTIRGRDGFAPMWIFRCCAIS
ncbi:MAG: TetR/AcrR family transcriptional regulator [Mesorhizobium sp.]|nr:MAG: TetR/AcrR family transcriptional regulator [Mesorhizobium sp.]